MPNRYIHCMYKEYWETKNSKEKQEAHAGEQLEEELENMMSGGA